MKAAAMMNYNGKQVEMYTSRMNRWLESWGEFVENLPTFDSRVVKVQEEQDFDSSAEYAEFCFAKVARLADRYEAKRAEQRDQYTLRALVELAHNVWLWQTIGDWFDCQSEHDRTELALMDVHETPYTTGYWGEN